MELTRQELTDIAYEADIDVPDEDGWCEGAYISLDYSGRGMYGRECVGIVGTPSDVTRFLFALADATSRDDVLELSASTDNMGLSMITYWGDLTVA